MSKQSSTPLPQSLTPLQQSTYHFVSQAKLPTAYGEFDIHVFENDAGQEHVMLTCGLTVVDRSQIQTPQPLQDNFANVVNNANANNTTAVNPPNTDPLNTTPYPTADQRQSPIRRPAPLVRIHSECLTGDAFASLKCDCGAQLDATMQAVQESGYGAILYLRQEGRGIGLTNKIRAYALQDQGHDTLDANLLLGLPADARTYEMCKPMLDHVGIQKLRLMTNNPKKLRYLEDLGFEIVERIPLVVGLNALNVAYLNTKRERMGHYLSDDLSLVTFKPIAEQ